MRRRIVVRLKNTTVFSCACAKFRLLECILREKGMKGCGMNTKQTTSWKFQVVHCTIRLKKNQMIIEADFHGNTFARWERYWHRKVSGVRESTPTVMALYTKLPLLTPADPNSIPQQHTPTNPNMVFYMYSN